MPPTRRHFLATTGSTLAATAVTAKDIDKPLFSFGLMADCQYADVPAEGQRLYRESPRKLADAIADLNKHDLAFTIHLGDWIDRDLASFDHLDPIAAKLASKLHHLLGNHDFDVADEHKASVPARLGLERGYYSFRKSGFRFVVLDTTEVGTYRYPADDQRTIAAQAELSRLEKTGAPCAQPWNSRPGDAQLAWIEAELRNAAAAEETVLVLGHHPILPAESHAAWNADALSALLDKFPCAKLYLNGHNHAGAYAEQNGFHYLTLDGMLDTRANAYAVAELFPDRLVITGFGRQESHVLAFR